MTTIGKGALLFLGGVLFGTAGIKVLSSKDAKKAYTHCTAAALRAKDSVMKNRKTPRISMPKQSKSTLTVRKTKSPSSLN